jgi:hypothetical protein
MQSLAKSVASMGTTHDIVLYPYGYLVFRQTCLGEARAYALRVSGTDRSKDGKIICVMATDIPPDLFRD